MARVTSEKTARDHKNAAGHPEARAPRRGDYTGPRSAPRRAKQGAPAPQVEKVSAPDAVRRGATRRTPTTRRLRDNTSRGNAVNPMK